MRKLGELYYQRTQLEKEQFRRFKSVCWIGYPVWQIIWIFIVAGNWVDIKDGEWWSLLISLFLGIIVLVSFIYSLYSWQRMVKVSHQIVKIDKEIAEELANSNF